MSIKIHIPSYFQSYTNNKEVVEANGSTVGECLEHLVSRFPSFKTMIFFKDGKAISFLGVFVNGEYSSPEKPVKSGDEIIIEAVGG